MFALVVLSTNYRYETVIGIDTEIAENPPLAACNWTLRLPQHAAFPVTEAEYSTLVHVTMTMIMTMTVSLLRVIFTILRCRRTALLPASALLAALQQTIVFIRFATTALAIDSIALARSTLPFSTNMLVIAAVRIFVASCLRSFRVIVILVEAEFRLNGGGVDAVVVEASADGEGKLHVARAAFILEVELDLYV